MSALSLIITVSLAQNVVLVHYLGVFPLPAVVRSPRRATVMSGAVTAALLWVAVCYWIVHRYVLVPLGLEVLGTLTLAGITAASVLAALRLGTMIAPFHRRRLRRALPAALVNATVFVVSAAAVDHGMRLWEVLLLAPATGAGLLLALVPMAAIRSELRDRRVPAWLRGDASVYLAAAMMALVIQQLDRALHQFFVPLY
jgi:electron transport complex protein RnfA